MRSWPRLWMVTILTYTHVNKILAQRETFLSRPGQSTVALDVRIDEEHDALAPGYIFVTPHTNFFANPTPEGMLGPTIFDSRGNLVWAGNYTAENRVSCLDVCDYKGVPGQHLCYNDGKFLHAGGHSAGVNRIFDNTYTEVQRIGPTHNMIGGDMHEFNVPKRNRGKSMLQTVYTTVPMDLRKYSGDKDGYAISGCFQDIELPTGKLLFEWCSLDHVPIDDALIYLPASGNFSKGSGAGTKGSPYDYFHINSIDVDDFGDYYVSGKKTSAIYKVAGLNSAHGKPGHIIWTLGGTHSDFTLQGFNYSWQHHVRVYEVAGNLTTLSLFDNHWTGDTPRKPVYVSNGKIIQLNTDSMTVELLEQYNHPDGQMAGVQGSTQVLPNGNVFMGWGPLQSISEHAPGKPGKVLWYAVMGEGMFLESYRNFKAPWKGYPQDPPDVFAYAQNCTADLVVYMSWNGATEHHGWRIFVTDDKSSPGQQIGEGIWAKTGYETIADVGKVNVSSVGGWVYAQALDAANTVLGTSQPTRIFVPALELPANSSCGPTRCQDKFEYSSSLSMAAKC